MKNKQFLLTFSALCVLSIPVRSQDLPPNPSDLVPLPGSSVTMQTHDNIHFLQVASSTSTNGFSINLTGTQRMELDVDMSTGNNEETGSVTLGFNELMNLTMTQSPVEHRTNLSLSLPVSEVTVYAGALPGQTFPLLPGTAGSYTRYFPGPAPAEAETAPYLLGIKAVPHLPGQTALTLLFHEPVTYSVNSMVIPNVNELTFIVNMGYTSLGTFRLITSQIGYPVHIFDYVKAPSLPVVYTMTPFSGPPGTLLTLSGDHFRYISRISLSGLDVKLAHYLNTHQLTVEIPAVPPGIHTMVMESPYGVVTVPFPINVLPELVCREVPLPEIAFFTAASPGNADAVFKWRPVASPGAVYDVQYREQSAVSWVQVSGISSHELTVPGLLPGAVYEFQVRSVCSNSIASEWSTPASIELKYTDEISVSPAMHQALQDWWTTSQSTPAAMDAYLNTYTALTLDPREIASLLDRFFELSAWLWHYDLLGPRKISCMCKTVSPSMNIDLTMYEAEQQWPHRFEDNKTQKSKQVGKIYGAFGYRGAANFIRARVVDFRTSNNSNKRHTLDENAPQREEVNGEASSHANPQSHSTVVISYFCANNSKLPSACGCAKDLSVIAQVKGSTCVNVHQNGCFDAIGLHPKGKNRGARAESGFGGIILTGTIIKNDITNTLKSIQVLNAANYGRYREVQYNYPFDSQFVKAGISLLYVGTMAALGIPDFTLTTMISNGTMDNVLSNLQTILTRPLRQQIQVANAGVDGCEHYTLNQPGIEYLMSISPGQTKFVTVASTSFAEVKAWGCTYEVEAYTDVRYYLAVASMKYTLQNKPTCCVNSRAIFSTRAIDAGSLKGIPGDKENIETFLYKYGDKSDPQGPFGTISTTWARADGALATDLVNDQKIVPWHLFTEPKGLLVGWYLCKPQLLSDSITIWPVVLGQLVINIEWDHGVAKDKSGYILERSLDGTTFAPVSAEIPRDSSTYSDTVYSSWNSVYYRLRAVHTPSGMRSEHTDVVHLVLPMAKTGGVKKGGSIELGKLDVMVAPNTFEDRFRLTCSLPEKTDITIDAYDMSGRKIGIVSGLSCSQGVRILDVDASAWSAGSYYLVLTSPLGQVTRKLVKY